MLDKTKAIGDLLPEDIGASGDSPEGELSVADKAKFRQLLSNKRSTFVANGVKRFKSFEEAYERLLVPVFKENDRKPPSLSQVIADKLLLESWVEKSVPLSEGQKKVTERLETAAAKPSPSETSQPDESTPDEPVSDNLPDLTDEEWALVDEIAHPFSGGRFFAPVITPQGLQKYQALGLISQPMLIYFYLAHHVDQFTGDSSKDFTIERLGVILEMNNRQVRKGLKKLVDSLLVVLDLHGGSEMPRNYLECFKVHLPEVVEARQRERASRELRRKTKKQGFGGDRGLSAYQLWKRYRQDSDEGTDSK